MSDISRKALIEKLEHEADLAGFLPYPRDEGALFMADTIRTWVDSIPSTESEGEVDQYDLQMTAELGRLARENGRLRAALEHLLSKAAIKGDFTTVHYINNSLSPHREDAEITNPITQAIRDFMPTTDQQAGYDALVAWLESTTPFTLEDGRNTDV